VRRLAKACDLFMSTGSLRLVFPFAFICYVIVLSSLPLPAFGQMYRWEDEKGTVHVTDDPSMIPESHRSTAEKSKGMPSNPSFEGKWVVQDELEKSYEPRAIHLAETRKPTGVDTRKWMNQIVYLAGLLILLAVLTKMLMRLRPMRVKRRIDPGRPALSARRPAEFKVYHRDDSDQSMVFLGMIRERRKRERRQFQ
jgi:hypothetical protein